MNGLVHCSKVEEIRREQQSFKVPPRKRCRRFVERMAIAARTASMLFDPGHSLDECILREQFGY
jgi:hypothetical protein